MVYRRSHEIEKRLEEVLRLICVGRYATPSLAKALGVSIPTVSRCVTALRERGHEIRAVKHAKSWQYILDDPGEQIRRGLRDENQKASRREVAGKSRSENAKTNILEAKFTGQVLHLRSAR